MVGIAEPATAVQSIEATLNYFRDTGEKPFTATGGPGLLDVRTGGGQDPQRVVIRNGRLEPDGFMLDRNGFRFVRHDTKVADFFDEAEIRATYYPEMEALVKAQTGAARVVVFDHTLRTADDAAREARKIREVVRRVHNDYTEWSGPQRLRDLLPQEAEALLRRRCGGRSAIRSRPSRSPSAMRRPLARGSGGVRTPLSGPHRPDLCDHPQSGAPLVLVSADAARRGAGLQGLRFDQGLSALDRPYRLRRPDRAARRPPARKHRDPHAGAVLAT